jgi:ankyrin repeat protein
MKQNKIAIVRVLLLVLLTHSIKLIAMGDGPQRPTYQMLVRDADNVAELETLMSESTSKYPADDALMSLISCTVGVGTQVEAKIDFMLDLYDRLSPRETFKRVQNTIITHIICNHTNEETNPNTVIRWIEWFIERGASVDAVDKTAHTPLVWAIEKLRPDVVAVLLKHGANPHTAITEQNNTTTALAFAINRQQNATGEERKLLDQIIVAFMATQPHPNSPEIGHSSEAFNYAQEQQIYRARTIDELNQIIGNNNDPLLLKKVLLVLVEKGWASPSALKINYLLQQISTLDPNALLIRFDDAQDDIIGYLIQNHRPASNGESNTYLPAWIAWFVQRGVAVDALSDEKSVSAAGWTPLMWAVFYKRPDVVLRLLELGAQVSTVNKPEKEKPLTVLERYGDSNDPEIIPIVNLLKTYPHHTAAVADTTIQTSNPEPTALIVTPGTTPIAATANIASSTAAPTISTSTTDAHPSSIATAAPQMGRALTSQELEQVITLINHSTFEAFSAHLALFKGVNFNQYVLDKNKRYVNLFLYVLQFPVHQRLLYAQLLIDCNGTDLNTPLVLNGAQTTLFQEMQRMSLKSKNEVWTWLHNKGLERPLISCTTPPAPPNTSIVQPQFEDPTAPVIVTPTQPHTKNATVAAMLTAPKLLLAAGIMLALYAGYLWLSKQPTDIEDDTDEGSDTPANQKSTNF